MNATPDFKLIVTVTSARKDVGTLDEQEVTLTDLEESCTTHEIGDKDGTALIPAEFGPCSEPCRNVTKGAGWDCGGGAIHRLSANVLAMTALGTDLDDITSETVDKITDAMQARGLYFIVWTTHSNAPPERCRLRLLFPFAEPLRLTNPRQWSAVAWPALVQWLGLPLGTDFSCRNPDRIYYLPRVPTAETPRAAAVNRGTSEAPAQLLDWRDVPGLQEALAAATAVQNVPVVAAPEEDSTRPVDVDKIREGLKGISTNPFLPKLLRGEVLTPPQSRRAPGELSRREAWLKVTVDLANYVDGWEDSQILADELLRPSWRAEVQDSPDDYTPWEKIVELFTRARGNAPAYKAEKAARQAARTELMRASIRRRHQDAQAEIKARDEAGVSAGAPAASTEAPRPPVERSTTDIGNAERFADRNRGRLLHVYSSGAWLAFDGRRWANSQARAHMAAQDTAKSILGEAAACIDPDKTKKLTSWAMASHSAKTVMAMISLARPHLAIEHDALDADPLLFNCMNGTLDLNEEKLRSHDPADMLTKLSPVAYDPEAACPAWEKFLARILPDDEVRAYVQRALGYTLTGLVSEQVMFFLHGFGSNGKSTFLTALQHVFGDYGTQGAPDLLLATSGEPHPTSQAALTGVRFVVCSEVEQGRAFAENTIKQLTGGDMVRARFMRQDFFTFKPSHKIFLAANHKPKVRGTDHAIWRRLRLIPFMVQIGDEEKDPQLPAKLEAEAAGILAWCVRGYRMWKAQQLGNAGEVIEATKEYRADQDLIALFLSDCTDAEAGSFTSSAELYRAYEKWCVDSGEKPWTGRALSNAMVERGYSTGRRAQVRGFVGLKVRQQSRASQVALAGSSATQPEANA
jgi:putative DNA primase/helicase